MTDLGNIKAIGERLRAARELLGRSIDDVALTTRIDRKYLDDIERGILPPFPQTYIRAFVQDYARAVDLDPVQIFTEISTTDNVHDENTHSDAKSSPFNITTVRKSPVNQYRVLFLLAMLVVLGLVATIMWLRKDNSISPASEISFSDVIKDREQKLVSATMNDSTILKKAPAIAIDTLFLDAVASESVWVRVMVDGAPAPEKIIPRFSHLRWKAKQLFVLSIGNAAAVSFTLNGRKLGTLSPIKRQMNNIRFDRETLRKLEVP
jgi:transcriptional regulator with XRE-family HTH domain